MASIHSVTSLKLALPPSCIQFCPTQPDIFVVGSYFLHGKEHDTQTSEDIQDAGTDSSTLSTSATPQKRTGSLDLFRLVSDRITLLSTLPSDSAILDLQWTLHPDIHRDLLAVATSTGQIAFYRLLNDYTGLALLSSHSITSPTTLVLSLTWHPLDPHTLGVTLSDGKVCLVKLTTNPDSTITVTGVSTIHSHDLEAWCLTFNPFSNTILSGGDDVALRCTSTDGHTGFVDRKLHDAGVTAILPLSGSLVVTGSYDDRIRLLDVPPTGRRRVLVEADLGGGVWRLKLLICSAPSSSRQRYSYIFLASCMHAGTRIVRLERDASDVSKDETGWRFEVLAKFEEHQSMNYGSDVQPHDSTNQMRERAIVSTSFYDRLLCLWKFKPVDMD